MAAGREDRLPDKSKDTSRAPNRPRASPAARWCCRPGRVGTGSPIRDADQRPDQRRGRHGCQRRQLRSLAGGREGQGHQAAAQLDPWNQLTFRPNWLQHAASNNPKVRQAVALCAEPEGFLLAASNRNLQGCKALFICGTPPPTRASRTSSLHFAIEEILKDEGYEARRSCCSMPPTPIPDADADLRRCWSAAASP